MTIHVIQQVLLRGASTDLVAVLPPNAGLPVKITVTTKTTRRTWTWNMIPTRPFLSSVRANVVRHLSGIRVIIAPTETVAVLPALYVHLLKRKFSMMHEATVSAVPVGAQGQAKNQRTVDATAGVVEITLSIQFHLGGDDNSTIEP